MARKKQGYSARLDESMGGRSGRKSQSEKSRRDESTGMESSTGRRKYAAVGTMDKSGRVKKRGGGTAGGRTAADSAQAAQAGSTSRGKGLAKWGAALTRGGRRRGMQEGGTVGGRTAADSARAVQAGKASMPKLKRKWDAALTNAGKSIAGYRTGVRNQRGMQEGGLAGGSLSDLGFGGGAPDIQPDLSGVAEAIGRMPSEVDMAYEVPMYGEYGDPSMTGGRTEGYIPRHPGNALGSQNAPLGGRKLMQEPRGMRHGGMATMPSSNTTVRGPHGSTATSKNTNQHKLNAMGKLKGQ
jgi:hypothetical protein